MRKYNYSLFVIYSTCQNEFRGVELNVVKILVSHPFSVSVYILCNL